MKHYKVSFFNCAGEVTDTYDFDAGAEVDMERMVRQFWGECDDKIHGFEVRDANGAIVKCLKPIRQHSTGGTAEPQETEASTTEMARLAHSPRRRRVRWAAGAIAMLVVGGALVISHTELVLAGVHKVATSSTSALNSILPSAAPVQSSSAVLDRPPVPSTDSAIYRSMLDGFAKYQRLMLDATASEFIADNEFVDVKPRRRIRHKTRRMD